MARKSKSNISLLNLAEIRNGGIFLALRKGANELCNRETGKAAILSAKGVPGQYQKKISVIICSANRFEMAADAAKSIISQDFPKDMYEIILVNNSGRDFPGHLLPSSVHIVDEEILGLSRARNRGAEAAKGEYLLFVDDDSRACDGLLKEIYSAFERHPKTAIVGGQIYLKLPNPLPEVFLEGKEAIWSGFTVPYNKFKEAREQYEFPYGACFAIRHSVLDMIGGFSLEYGRVGNDFAGGEETALCFAARRLGFKIGIEPRAAVEHLVERGRFTKEHIKRTIRAGILTTHRLYLDGYAPGGWTHNYVKERIKIIQEELKRLQSDGDKKAELYKKSELDAFIELRERYFNII